MVESSMVLWGDRIIALSRGRPSTVEFDFETVWNYMKNSPYIFSQQELTWLHVHPIGYGTQASSTDINCAEGLQAAFGNMGWFGILCFRNYDPDEAVGDIEWYRWANGQLERTKRYCRVSECGGKKVEDHIFRIGDWFREEPHVPYMLKAMSMSRTL